MNIRKEDALAYHQGNRNGKIEIVPSKPVSSIRDLSLAYSPGVAFPCLEIAADVSKVYDYTAKGNIVAVISNGTAVLGLGNIGPEAAKPVMEGKAILLKKYADIDGLDIEISATKPEEFIQIVKNLEPSFGAINLEDIKSPECFLIEQKLKEILSIPVMHDDQHGTAIISGAALLNALEIAQKDITRIRMVISGAGAAAIACANFYVSLGVLKQHIVMVDKTGVIHKSRPNLDTVKSLFATDRNDIVTLADAMANSDVFVGLSSADLVTPDMLLSMNENPIVFALANPDPEIAYPLAMATRSDIIMATGRSDYPNQVNNVLGFPYIFRGALDVRATTINEEMKMAAARAIASLAHEPVPEAIASIYEKHSMTFGREYLIPKPMDTRLLWAVSSAVAKAAIKTNVATKPIEDWDSYKEQLESRLGLNKGFVRTIVLKAQQSPKRIILSDAESYKILKAAQITVDEGIARPILVGNESKIRAKIQEYEIDITGIQIVDPEPATELREQFANWYFQKRQRKGVRLIEARNLMLRPDYFGLMMVELGLADALITGLGNSYPVSITPALEVIGKEDAVKTLAGLYILNTKRGLFFFADTTINKQPTTEQLVEIAELTVRAVRFFNIQPRVALLSYSNFGSNRDTTSQKIQQATLILQQKHPNLILDGDIQANFAMRTDLLQEFFPFSQLAQTGANTFIFPDLTSANIAYKLIQEIGGIEAIGPVLLGLNKPVHILQMGSSVREIVNMISIAVVDAQSKNEFF